MMRGSRILVVGSLVAFGVLALILYALGRRAGGGASEKALIVYCAAGIKPPVVELAQSFEAEYGIPIQLHYGGSGTLLANLKVAPQGDLYLAGDVSYVEKARDEGLVREILPLAFMTPVIAVPAGNPKGIGGIADLLRDDIRVAAGNPDAAAIGRETTRLLARTGQWNAFSAHVEKNGVFKPTVPEIANDVKLGALDAGIVWDATAGQYPDVEAVAVPQFEDARQDIAVGVLAASAQPTAALRFARYLNSRIGNGVFKKHGCRPVDGDKWAWQPELTFFCGAVNRRAIDAVIKEFEQREGVVVNTVYNGCGILTAQMRTIRQDSAGAGFPDTYMACDRYYLDTVSDWFQEDVDVSEADIVIAVQKGNPKQISGLRDLAAPGTRVAVGQPEQCTIGALTRFMLKKEGLYDQVMANVVRPPRPPCSCPA
jgi:molybdenum ABC transporter molybdate-binding protein